MSLWSETEELTDFSLVVRLAEASLDAGTELDSDGSDVVEGKEELLGAPSVSRDEEEAGVISGV